MDHSPQADVIDRAIRDLFMRHVFTHDGRDITIVLLVRKADIRPLKAPWWHGPEVSIVAVDVDGNFFLRHSGGSVRYWNHRTQSETLVAPSIRAFVAALT